MNGTVALVGFMITYGAVGTLDADPTASVVKMFALACAGLCMMFAGTMGLTHSR
jgi:hypothetical protein